MKYTNIVKGHFICRPNRFIAQVLVNGREITAHVKNTGRCRELLTSNATVLLQHHPDAGALGRKTEYSLIGVYKGALLINMDSQAPNQAALEWMEQQPEVSGLQREVVFGQSRFDLAFIRNEGIHAFMEVKGVTLEDQGIARFPDAPTLRGVKHLQELIHAVESGYEAYILFVIQMKNIREFQPNRATHPQFAQALLDARNSGVHILAYDCLVTEDSLCIHMPVPVVL